MSRIIVVDENDTPIGVKERDALVAGDIYRVSAIWVTKPSGDILLAKRALTKKNSPGLWGPAVSGTIEDGEEYLKNAVKEAEEEIGLKVNPAKLIPGPKQKINRKNGQIFFCQWFYYTTDMPVEVLVLKEDEVAELHWFSRNEVREMVEKHPEVFLESVKNWIYDLLDQPKEEE